MFYSISYHNNGHCFKNSYTGSSDEILMVLSGSFKYILVTFTTSVMKKGVIRVLTNYIQYLIF